MNRLKHTVVVLAALFVSIQACRAQQDHPSQSVTGAASQPEILALQSETQPQEQEKLVKKLVLRVGPEQAQEELLRSGLPFTGETHLIIHTVGALIYQNFGTQGLTHCRPYFLGACYHGFLIEAIGQHGEDVVGNVWPQCREAGVPLMHQCAHAAGHGLMANRHSIPTALAECDSLSAHINDFPSVNCYDGVFMENLWKVHHGHLSHELNISNDILYPCDDPNLQGRYQPACWGNQVSVLYQVFKGNLAKIGDQCDSLPDAGNRDACFNGLARQINSVANGSPEAAFKLCAASGRRQDSCLITNAEAAFAIGDQVNFPFQVCKLAENDQTRAECYDKLSSVILTYTGNNHEKIEQICTSVPNERNKLEVCSHKDGMVLASVNPGASETAGHFVPAVQVDSGTSANSALTPASSAQIIPVYPVPYPMPYPYPYPMPYPEPYPVPYQYPYPVPYTSPPPN